MNEFTTLCDEYSGCSVNNATSNVTIDSNATDMYHDENFPPLDMGIGESGSPSVSYSREPLATLVSEVENPRNPRETAKERNTRPGILRDLLEKDPNGRAVVIKYDRHNSLTKNLRSRLVRFVIDLERKKSFRSLKSDELISEFNITTEKFVYLSEEICRTFPRESPFTYYTPFRCENGTAVNASGKLWWHYDYTKKKLFEDGILKGRGKKSNVVLNNFEATASCSEKLRSLSIKMSPWNEVVQLWKDTYDARQNELTQKKWSVQTYIEKFLCLRVKDALSLYEADFAKLQPLAVGRLTKYWDVTTNHLIHKLNSVAIKDPRDIGLRILLSSTNSDQNTAVLLSLLHYLVPPRRPGRKRKNQDAGNNQQETPRMLSLQERKESFFVHIPNVVDLHTVLSTGINHATRLHLQHQPIPVIVGPFDNISASYVLLEDNIYESKSILHAFESTIQICYAVNCEYPLNARSLWIFLQQAYLNVNEVTDKPSSEVTALIGEIKAIISQGDSQ